MIKHFLGSIILAFLSISTVTGQSNALDLSGKWNFQIDREDTGVKEQWFRKILEDHINLPGSMPEKLKGDEVTVHTQWTGSLYDSSYYFNPYMEKYRMEGQVKLPFFLTPDKHYVGVAWYQKNVTIPSDWKGMGNNWSDVCADELATYGKVLEVPQQEDFYRSRIQTSDTKVFVIISDAMRYEVAATMADQLQRETQSKVSISSMQSIFPSTTKFGMAALLPHKELTVEVRNDILTVLADGQSTASTYRDKVLKTEDSASVALKYNDIIAMKRAERCALVKGMDVVYIYHDTIDEASHTSDIAVFAACDKAISELKNLVRIIVNEFGGTNILITADHGFLYTYSPLKEEDKVDKRGFFDVDVTNTDITKKESIKRCVEYGRRYAIMQKGVQPDYLMPVKFLGGNTEFNGFAPRESIRIKMNGGGMNFVHGGISLQEMVVPVIEYHYLRNDSMEYRRNKQKYDTKPVTVNLLSANRKISNMIFSLNFYQKDAVSTNREAATYQVYFTDEDGKQISDIQKIIADKTSDNGAERTFRCQFNLKSLKYSNTATYYLVIADEQGLQLPQREPFQIDIAFAVDEFDFFS